MNNAGKTRWTVREIQKIIRFSRPIQKRTVWKPHRILIDSRDIISLFHIDYRIYLIIQKWPKKYEKIKPVFPKNLSTIFTLTYTYRLDSINMTMTCQTIGPALERTHRSSLTPSRAHRPKHISFRFIS
jgi:hypothetical protein